MYFFIVSTGTSTDLVPQLLGMFDELARRGEGCTYGDHVVIQSSGGACNIPVAIQKRLSLVPHSHRSSIFGQLCSSENSAASTNVLPPSNAQPEAEMESTRNEAETMPTTTSTTTTTTINHPVNPLGISVVTSTDNDSSSLSHRDIENETPTTTNDSPRSETLNEKSIYRRESSGLTPLRYSRRCNGRGTGNRPLSGSSIASSTSSSGCSNQGNANAANPYLTSVESLADTCASSQGNLRFPTASFLTVLCRFPRIHRQFQENKNLYDFSLNYCTYLIFFSSFCFRLW